MRIICLEEHVIDRAIVAASQYEQHKQAAFAENWGSRVIDKASPTSRKPELVSPQQAQADALAGFADRVAEMDQHGIDMQVLSYTHEMQFTPAVDAPRLCAAANDKLLTAGKSHPGRFASFSTLPWTQPTLAVAELERTTGLGMQGTLLPGRPGDSFLDDPYYRPVLAKLNQLKVPLYLHPGFPLPAIQKPYYGGLDCEVTARLSMFGWGWHNEAGIQVIRMILAGIFELFPDLQIISGHWGEMVPFFLQRLDDSLPLRVTGLSLSITETYKRNFFVTPSGMLSLPHFNFIHELMGADRLLYAVDYPYLTMNGARTFIDSLSVSRCDREKLACRNAEALLRLS